MKPNIIFFLVDGARADKIFNYNKKAKTTNIEKLIKNGISFRNCYTSVDGTTMSLNCIFNSLYPTRTGLRTKKVILTENNFLSQLKDEGYHLFGYIPKISSFNSMLELFENEEKTYFAGPPVKHISETKNKIIELLNSIKIKEPWFCFIHFLDISAFRQEEPPYGIKEFLDNEYGELPAEKMISSIDHGIGEILKNIDMENTIIVLTSDHGSLIPHDNLRFTDFEPSFKKELELGKKIMPKSTYKIGGKIFSFARNVVRDKRLKEVNNELTWYQQRSRFPYFKQSLYDEMIHVPLIISSQNFVQKNIHELMSNMDIFPTIFDLIGIKNKKNIDGRSLNTIIKNGKLNEKSIYLHTMPHEKIEEEDTEGIRTSKFKFLRSANEPNENHQLYNLELDEFENKNIVKDLPEIEKELENKLEHELKKLGYM